MLSYRLVLSCCSAVNSCLLSDWRHTLPWRFSPRLHTDSQHWSHVPACWQFFLSSPYSGSCTSPFNLRNTTLLPKNISQRSSPVRCSVLKVSVIKWVWKMLHIIKSWRGVCVCVCVCVYVLVTQSCTILCDPMDCSSPGSSVHGILQARTLEWVAIPFSRGSSQSSQPRDQTHISCISCTSRWILYHWVTGKAHFLYT